MLLSHLSLLSCSVFCIFPRCSPHLSDHLSQTISVQFSPPGCLFVCQGLLIKLWCHPLTPPYVTHWVWGTVGSRVIALASGISTTSQTEKCQCTSIMDLWGGTQLPCGLDNRGKWARGRGMQRRRGSIFHENPQT